MTKYICKCGRAVKKNTSADVTGNRQTDDCQGCPYRMAYGNCTWAEDRHAFVTDIKGYECQMSQGITYYTELGGCLSDKTVLSVYSLDFDFLDVVCRWIRETYPGQELSAVFNREKVRKSEYSRCGRYRMAVYPASNKAGIAAKNEFARKFFDRESRRRLDLTPEQEKDKILADIAAGKAAAQKQDDTPMEIRQYKTDTGMIYAVRQQPEGGWRIMCRYPGTGWALTTDPRLSAECGCAESLQEVLDAYAQRKGWAVYDPPEASPTSPAAATAAAEEPASPPAEPAPANTTAEPAAGGSEPEANALAEHPVTSELPQRPGDVFKAPNGTLYKIADKLIGKQRCWHTVQFNPSTCEWLAVNSTVYDNLENALGEFAAWIRTENLKPVARNGAAAVTTDANAVKSENAVETQTTPADAATSPAPALPADTGLDEPALTVPSPASLAAASTTDMAGQTYFDYSVLSQKTIDTMHLAEDEIRDAKRVYISRVSNAVAMVHHELVSNWDELQNNQHSETTFINWCRSVGISKAAAYRFLQVDRLLSSARPDELATLETAKPSLLYAAAKHSADPEMVQDLKDGKISTLKEWNQREAELKAQLKAKSDELAAVKAEADRRAEQAKSREEEARAAAHLYHEKYEEANAARNAALDAQGEYIRRAADAEHKAARFEQIKDAALDDVKQTQAQLQAERSDSRRAAAELQQRIRELEARPVEVVAADPDEVARMAEEKAQAIAAQRSAERTRDRDALQERIEELEELLDDAAQDQIANTQALAAQAVETCESLMESLFGKILFLPDPQYLPAKRIVESFYAKLGWVLDNNDWPDEDDWALNHSSDDADEPDEEEAEEDE